MTNTWSRSIGNDLQVPVLMRFHYNNDLRIRMFLRIVGLSFFLTVLFSGVPVQADDKSNTVTIISFLLDNSKYSNSGTVISAGQVWMDRNLGTSRVATAFDDSEAYGDLYQWGRGTDGHEKQTSTTTSTLSVSDVPSHSNFILIENTPDDWHSPHNDNLWQGVSGINNPCPNGFRLPTETEWETERASWGSHDIAGAYASPLKLVVAGFRHGVGGAVSSAGASGKYWSSTVDGSVSRDLGFGYYHAFMNSNYRASGCSVRCIKD